MEKKILSFLVLMSFGLIVQSNAQDLKYEWGMAIGGTALDLSRALAVDEDGNAYVTGCFNGLVDFNPMDPAKPDTLRALLTSGDQLGDIYVYKLTADGKLGWIKRFKNASGQGYGIALDKKKNIYITGDFSRKADFNPSDAPADTFFLTPEGARADGNLTGNTSTTNMDVFVIKLDSSGNFVWAKNFGSPAWEQAFGIALDDNENVFVTGHFNRTANFDIVGGNPNATLTSLNSNFSYNAFVLKLRSNGDFAWVKGILGKGAGRGKGVATDQYGNVYAVGEFYDSISLDPARKYYQLGTGVTVARGNYDGYVVKLDSSGSYMWGKIFGGDKEDRCNAVAVDRDSGYVYSVYEMQSDSVDFGIANQLMRLRGFMDVAILKMDWDGNPVWQKNYGGFYSNTYGSCMVLDSKRGNIYIGGCYSYETNFNTGNNPSDTFLIRRPFGGNDTYINQVKTDGGFGWAKSFPSGTTPSWGYGIGLGPLGSVYSTGWFQGSIDVNGGANPADTAIYAGKGSYDFYVTKMSCLDTSSFYLKQDVDCNQSVFTYHGINYTESGIYHQMIPNNKGCDSFVTLELTFRTMVAPYITVNGFTLGVTSPYLTYQWLLNGQTIPNETNSTLSVQQNGKYQVVVTNDEGCVDTSDVYEVNNYTTDIGSLNDLANQINVYPNPATDKVFINAPMELNVNLTSIAGEKMTDVYSGKELSMTGLSSGIYLLHISDRDGNLIKVVKVIKN